MIDEVYDLVIVGGGPGGLTSAIYAGQAKVNTLLIERGGFGGQIVDSMDVENYPGISGVSGKELMDKFKHHADLSQSVSFLTSRVIGLEHEEDGLNIVHTKRRGSFKTRAVILDLGARPRQLGIPGEADFSGNGVSYCATCDAKFHQDQHVVVLGAGNQAIENAILLTKYASEVTVVVMHDQGVLDCNEADRREALSNQKINFVWNSTVSSINGTETVESVTLRNVLTGNECILKTSGVFSFVGMIPETDFLPEALSRDAYGYIQTACDKSTSIPGVYAVGDCTVTPLRQVVTAAADGAVAEVACERYLKEMANLEKILGNKSSDEAIVFYSPYNDYCVSNLQKLEQLLHGHYAFNVIDITTQKVLHSKLGVSSDFAVALYRQGNFTEVVDLTRKEAIEQLSKAL